MATFYAKLTEGPGRVHIVTSSTVDPCYGPTFRVACSPRTVQPRYHFTNMTGKRPSKDNICKNCLKRENKYK